VLWSSSLIRRSPRRAPNRLRIVVGLCFAYAWFRSGSSSRMSEMSMTPIEAFAYDDA